MTPCRGHVVPQLIAEAEAYEAEVVNRAAGDASRFDQVYQAYRGNPDVA